MSFMPRSASRVQNSILPGWARTNGNTLPPWYGPGGARRPELNVAPQPTMPTPSRPPVTIRSGSVAKSDAPSLGFGAKPEPEETLAPTNPWLEAGSNKPIYASGQPDTSLVDRLLAATQNQGNTGQMTAGERVYNRSGDLGGALGQLKDWTSSGGYSDQDLASLRARGVSPIRSVYANALRNLNRQKAIQGGYAPGFGAASSRMAREMSEQLSEANMKVNADIADRVQKGRAGALDRYSGLLGDENQIMAGFVDKNVSGKDDASRFNAGLESQQADQALQLAKLRQDIIDQSRAGQLQERNTSRAGNLGWEQLNQGGSDKLIDALMSQYGPNTNVRKSA